MDLLILVLTVFNASDIESSTIRKHESTFNLMRQDLDAVYIISQTRERATCNKTNQPFVSGEYHSVQHWFIKQAIAHPFTNDYVHLLHSIWKFNFFYFSLYQSNDYNEMNSVFETLLTNHKFSCFMGWQLIDKPWSNLLSLTICLAWSMIPEHSIWNKPKASVMYCRYGIKPGRGWRALTPITFFAPAFAANIHSIPVPHPTSRTVLPVKRCLLWSMEFL